MIQKRIPKTHLSMTRQPHDQLAKEYLEELLNPVGKVTTSYKVRGEVQEVDIFFEPDPSKITTELPLGLLGKVAQTSCLIEPFRNPPSEIEIQSCLLKLYKIRGERLRKGKQVQKSPKEAELPVLWILTPTLSQRMLEIAGGRGINNQDYGQGVYFLPQINRTGIIVIHQLPETEETLWLRVLGKGGTQKRAVEELGELTTDNPYREYLLEILANWRKNLEVRDNLSSEEQEVIMNLSPAYLKQREEWKEEGKQEGEVEGQLSLITSLLEGRFGALDPELSGLVAKIAQLPLSERTQLLLSLSSLSREELIRRLTAK